MTKLTKDEIEWLLDIINYGFKDFIHPDKACSVRDKFSVMLNKFCKHETGKIHPDKLAKDLTCIKCNQPYFDRDVFLKECEHESDGEFWYKMDSGMAISAYYDCTFVPDTSEIKYKCVKCGEFYR